MSHLGLATRAACVGAALYVGAGQIASAVPASQNRSLNRNATPSFPRLEIPAVSTVLFARRVALAQTEARPEVSHYFKKVSKKSGFDDLKTYERVRVFKVQLDEICIEDLQKIPVNLLKNCEVVVLQAEKVTMTELKYILAHTNEKAKIHLYTNHKYIDASDLIRLDRADYNRLEGQVWWGGSRAEAKGHYNILSDAYYLDR